MNTIKYNLQDFDFEKLARTEPNPKARIRLLILAHLKEGKTQVQAANALKVSPASVKRTYYEQIVDACCHAWNEFLALPDLIYKMCTREWALLNKAQN